MCSYPLTNQRFCVGFFALISYFYKITFLSTLTFLFLLQLPSSFYNVYDNSVCWANLSKLSWDFLKWEVYRFRDTQVYKITGFDILL